VLSRLLVPTLRVGTRKNVEVKSKRVGVEALAGGPAATTFNVAPTPTG